MTDRKFEVAAHRIFKYYMAVEADSEEEAEEKAKKLAKSKKFIGYGYEQTTDAKVLREII